MLIPIDEVVYFDVTTHVPSTAAVSDADSPPTFDVFEEATDTPILDDQAMTKRTSLTGNYRGTFTASAANGFEAGKWYSVVVSATVDSVAAKHMALGFRAGPAESVAGVPKVDTSHISGTAQTANDVGADVNDILVDTAEIGAAGAGLTNINLPNQTMDIVGSITGNLSGSVGSVTGAVGSVASGGITAASFAANAITAAKLDPDVTTELQAGLATAASIAALNNLSAAQVNTEVDTALTDIHLDHLLAVTYDPASKPGVADALLNELVESDAGVARYTANALEQAPTGGSAPSAADIADAVWDEDATAHQTQGTFGQAIGDPVADSDTIWALVNTNLNATVSSRATQTSVDDLPTNAELATALAAADDAVLAAIAALNNLSQANIRTAVGLGSANLDTQLDALPTNAELATALGTADDAVLAAIAALNNLSAAQVTAAVPTAAQNATGLLDLAAGIETGLTFRQAMRLIAAASAGKLSGAATTTVVIRNAVADDKDRVTATVDSDGNRSAITVDLT